MSQALWHLSSSHSELRDVAPPSDPQLVAIHALYSMISTGTERLIATGKAAMPGEALDAPFAEGSYGFPIKYGYSLVGNDPDGNQVHCLHPHQSVAYIDQRAAYRLPEKLDLRQAALLSNMETVLNAIWDAQIEKGQDVLLCGFGSIGALLANTLRVQNHVDPVVAEPDPWRRERAITLGFNALSPEAITQSFPCIIHSSCTPVGLQFCIDHCAIDGTVVEVSWYGHTPLSIDLGGTFHRNRVRLISSQVATISPRVSDEVDYVVRKDLACDLLADTSYGALITNEVSFPESPAFFDNLRQGRQGDGLIWLIKY